MPRLMKRVSKKIGLAPGTLVHIGEKKIENVKVTVLDYNETNIQEIYVDNIEKCFPFKHTPTVSWINIDGIHDVDIIKKLGDHFGIHPLVLEDIVNTEQRPKVESYEGYLYLIVKMFYHDSKGDEIIIEQISLVLGSNFNFLSGKRRRCLQSC